MRSRAPRWLHALSLPYGLVTQCRNILYDWKWLPQRKLPCRVVSVGNLTLGGTGKTPVAIFVTETLLKAGIAWPCSAVDIGAEAVRRASWCQTAIVCWPGLMSPAMNRFSSRSAVRRRSSPSGRTAIISAAGCWSNTRYCIVLDDGFQHRALARDVDLLLIDATDAMGLRDLVPAGRLREPLASAERASAWLVHASRVEDGGATHPFAPSRGNGQGEGSRPDSICPARLR